MSSRLSFRVSGRGHVECSAHVAIRLGRRVRRAPHTAAGHISIVYAGQPSVVVRRDRVPYAVWGLLVVIYVHSSIVIPQSAARIVSAALSTHELGR